PEFLNCAANAFASRRCTLSGQGPKFGDVCGEEFSAQARSERRAYPARGSVRSEQRSLGRKEPPPGGLRRIWPGASLLVGHSPTAAGCSRCPCGSTSRLAPGQIGRNKRHRIYAHDHQGLGSTEKLASKWRWRREGDSNSRWGIS